VLATAGLGTTAYAAYSKEPGCNIGCLWAISRLMEHAAGLHLPRFIDQCSLPLQSDRDPARLSAPSPSSRSSLMQCRCISFRTRRGARIAPVVYSFVLRVRRFHAACNSIHLLGRPLRPLHAVVRHSPLLSCMATGTSPGRSPPTVCATALPTGSAGTASQLCPSPPECCCRYCTGRG